MRRWMDKLVLLLQWVAFRGRMLLAAAGGGFLFVLLPLLARVDIGPALYAAGICLFLLLLWSLYDCARYFKKSTLLKEVIRRFEIMPLALPEPRDAVERQYQTLIWALYEDRARLLAADRKERGEREDYYTMWVHQIKTPIAALRLLLQSGDLPGNRFSMERELFKIEQYAKMVLQYLRLESLSYDLVLRSYPLRELIKQAVRTYSHLFIGKRISLTLEEFEFEVVTDEKWLVFVLEQLLSNNVKYTRQGGVHVCMDPDCERTLLIADTGIGIRPEDIPRVFDRGFTGYNGRLEKSSTGIGLYLCKRVTDRLGIAFTVASRLGEGTQYRLKFPERSSSLQD